MLAGAHVSSAGGPAKAVARVFDRDTAQPSMRLLRKRAIHARRRA